MEQDSAQAHIPVDGTPIGGGTLLIGDDGHIDLLQRGGGGASRDGVPPARGSHRLPGVERGH